MAPRGTRAARHSACASARLLAHRVARRCARARPGSPAHVVWRMEMTLRGGCGEPNCPQLSPALVTPDGAPTKWTQVEVLGPVRPARRPGKEKPDDARGAPADCRAVLRGAGTENDAGQQAI